MDKKFEIFGYKPDKRGWDYTSVGWDQSIGISQEGKLVTGVASCLAVTLYDPSAKKGTLCHITGFNWRNDGINPANSIDTMLRQLGVSESDSERLEASIAGEGVSPERIKKSEIVRQLLGYYKIPVIGEDLGGGWGRTVVLHGTGVVHVYRRSRLGVLEQI